MTKARGATRCSPLKDAQRSSSHSARLFGAFSLTLLASVGYVALVRFGGVSPSLAIGMSQGGQGGPLPRGLGEVSFTSLKNVPAVSWQGVAWEVVSLPAELRPFLNVDLFPDPPAPVASWAFDRLLRLRGPGLAIGVHLDRQVLQRGKDEPPPAPCNPGQLAWVAGTLRGGPCPAVLLHNCAEAAWAAGQRSSRAELVLAEEAAAREEDSVSASQDVGVGIVLDWLATSDVVADYLFISFDRQRHVPGDPIAFMRAQPGRDLFLASGAPDELFGARYRMCFGGEQPPMLPQGLNRPELSLAYIGGRTHAVVRVLQRIRAVLEALDRPTALHSKLDCTGPALLWVANLTLTG
ncbi:hypothetical protein APUTEX25_000960, partial [Auxenochlorella protothecoides]